MTQDKCKKVLTAVWFSLSGLMFGFLVLYTVNGTPFGERTPEVWSWLLPNIIPTLMLIVSVLVWDAKSPSAEVPTPSPFLFRLALALSTVYLATLLVLIVYPANFTDQPPLNLLKASGTWLGPFQGLVTGALGGFFVKKS